MRYQDWGYPRWASEDHQQFADTVRKFYQAELEPNREQWTKDHMVAPEFWLKAGDLGILGASVPEEHGGLGLSRSFDIVTFLEQSRIGDIGWGFAVHNILAHYIAAYGTEDQKARWLPGLATGEFIGAIAMTEPGAGSDLKAIRSTAVSDGDDYVINGSKTFISNGQTANLLVVVTKTDSKAGAKGVSLFIVETDEVEGFRRGRNLEKIGMLRQDTSELFFEDVRVHKDCLLGGVEGQGFIQLMTQLPWERMIMSYTGLGAAEYAVRLTTDYVCERKAFGKRVMDFQNTRFKLAEQITKVEVLRSFLDDCMDQMEEGTLSGERAAMAKYWATETQCQVVDECLQLFGGYGYMMEYPIAELYADARVQKIYGGTSEIMKEIIARGLDQD